MESSLTFGTEPHPSDEEETAVAKEKPANPHDFRNPPAVIELGAPQTVAVRCIAGHMWELGVGPRERAGKACGIHAKFFNGAFDKRYQPPERVTNEWEDAEENLINENGYAKRWRKVWQRVCRIVAARQNSWSLDIDLIEEYVRHLRLAEIHRLYAQDEPYIANYRGTVRPHPGWNLAREEERCARAIANELGLEGSPTDLRGALGEKSPDSSHHRHPSVLEQEVEAAGGIIDNQVGPDGRPL